MTSPPAPIQVMAGIILGPVGSAYGLITGNDMVTGEELCGLDYVFNALDFIPGGSVLGDIGGSLIKKLDIVTSSKVLKIGENLTLYKSYRSVIKGINTTLIGAEKLVKSAEDLVVKVMAWSGNMVFDQGNKLIKLVSKNGLDLGAIKGNKLNLSSSAVVTTQGGQTFKLGDDVEVYIDGEKKAEKYEMVKKEDGETGFRKVDGAGTIFNVGDNIGGKIVQKVLSGTNGKVAIVGRKMEGHVEDAAITLRAEGKQVEIFSEMDQKNNLFNIDGSNKTWQDIVDDFGNKNGQYLTNEKGWILDSELPKTMMFKANKIWAEKLKTQGYTVIDIGYPAGANLPQSVFYNMEI